ncbi:hypothetical protein Tco_0678997 [Tanacetum coccineum]|uniref:Uncharacterized protein n=1 Tax=Tanacetum coccineum TaxID=301880 RepID=A0ABQ4XHL8_9ASTR
MGGGVGGGEDCGGMERGWCIKSGREQRPGEERRGGGRARLSCGTSMLLNPSQNRKKGFLLMLYGGGGIPFQLKSDSLPHAHAQTIKTYYKHQENQESRKLKIQKTKRHSQL